MTVQSPLAAVALAKLRRILKLSGRWEGVGGTGGGGGGGGRGEGGQLRFVNTCG